MFLENFLLLKLNRIIFPLSVTLYTIIFFFLQKQHDKPTCGVD